MSFIVKNTTFPGLLDLIAPLNCRGCGRLGTPLCDRCKNYIKSAHVDVCPNCKNRVFSGRAFGGFEGVRRHGREVARRPRNDGRRRRAPRNTESAPIEPQFLQYRKLKMRADLCLFCHLPRAYIVGERDGLLDQLIQDYKYQSVRAIGRELADLLSATLPKNLPKNTIIVPLPTSHRHVRARALDHTYKIAKYVAKTRGLKVQRLLLRAKDTTQVGSTEKVRLKQAREAYVLNPKHEIDPSATYLLFDDVWTTGASMKAALEHLRQAGAKHLRIALLAVNHLTS